MTCQLCTCTTRISKCYLL